MSLKRAAATTIAAAMAALLLAATTALASGITNSSEDLRTGWYPNESAITPGLVSGGTFGQEWSSNIEGQVYAQPLLDENTLLVATEKNRVYGLNPTNGEKQWSKTLPTSSSLPATPWNPGEISCADLTPEVGVTSTPVIDPATGVAYMTHKGYASGSSGPVEYWMDAIELATGNEKPGFPVELAGTAQNASHQTFAAKTELQRPGLLLLEGVVYAGFGSDCDAPPFQGWIFGVSESGAVKARWTSETDDNGGGIWQSGAGLASDGPGTILFSTGNGATPLAPTPGDEPPGTLSEAVVRVHVQTNGELNATDFFAPYDAATLASWDADFASGGVTGLPGEFFGTASVPHLAVAVGKDGYVYLLNRDNLGGIGEGPGEGDKVVQRIGPNGGVWSRPGVWPGQGGWVYIPTASNGESAGGSAGKLDVYRYGVSGGGQPTLSLAGVSSDAFGFGSGAPIITSSGTTAGSALVWTEWMPNGNGTGAQLRAYDPVPVGGKPSLRWSASIGTASKFATPGVGEGRLYVGTRDGHVLAFGSPVKQPLSGAPTEFPTTTLGSQSAKTVTLTANEALEITELSSSDSGEFEIGEPTPSLTAHLGPGQSITIPVVFRPGGTGPRAATLTATLAGGTKAQFSLTGKGQTASATLEASPTVLSFGGTAVGNDVSATATFTNIGASSLEVQAVAAPQAPFVVEPSALPSPGSQIGPGHSITIPVSFDPAAIGSYEGAIELQTSAGPAAVQLTGAAAPPGVLQITPEAIAYGGVIAGHEATRSFTVSNTGGVAITIFKSKPPVGGEFAATTSLPEDTTIAPGESLVESVRFAPSATGAASGTWLINGEGSSVVHEVEFTGQGEAMPSGPLTPPLTRSVTQPKQSPGLAALLSAFSMRAGPAGRVAVRVQCPKQPASCTGTVTIRTGGVVRLSPHQRRAAVVTLATGSFRIAAGHTGTVMVRLTRQGRVLLARDRTMHVAVWVDSRDASGLKHAARSVATLRAAVPVHRR
jgi:iron transport multicopper oxidase